MNHNLKVVWNRGIHIWYKGTNIILDPQSNRLSQGKVFVSHGHFDHSAGFKIDRLQKYSSKMSLDLFSIYAHALKVKSWTAIEKGKSIVFNDVKVTAHNSGHVLGSYAFEITTPEGTALFTGDFNTCKTRTMQPAKPVSCDVLILESTFGSPNFVFPREEVIGEEMVKWAKRVIKTGKIPAFQTDPLGNAQEIVSIFNETSIPVITHQKVTQINKVYRSYGHNLDYLDVRAPEAKEVQLSGNMVYVTPKKLKLDDSMFEAALVSGWALWTRKKAFPLSDHADFPRLVEFVRNCNPRIVLTCHGNRFDETLAIYIERQLGIKAYPIRLIPTDFQPRTSKKKVQTKLR